MNNLSEELISYIGNFLDLDNIRNCIDSSKIFKSIAYNNSIHVIKIDQNNYYKKLENIFNIINYINKIKPNINEICIYFTSIENFNFKEILNFNDKIYVNIENCQDIQNILNCLSINFSNIRLIYNNYYNRICLKNISHKILLLSINDSNIHLLNSSFIKNLKEVIIHLYHEIIDLSLINDLTKVFLFILGNNISIIDPYKISYLYLHIKSSYLSDQLYNSLSKDHIFMKKSKLSKIYIDINNQYLYNEDSILLKLINLFPKNINYYVIPKNNNNIISFLDNIKENNIKLYYSLEKTYLECKLIQLIYNYDIYTDSKNKFKKYNNIEELLPDLPNDLKWTWYPIIKKLNFN